MLGMYHKYLFVLQFFLEPVNNDNNEISTNDGNIKYLMIIKYFIIINMFITILNIVYIDIFITSYINKLNLYINLFKFLNFQAKNLCLKWRLELELSCYYL